MRFYAECPRLYCRSKVEIFYPGSVHKCYSGSCGYDPTFHTPVYGPIKIIPQLTPLEEMNMWLHELYRVGLYDVLGFSQIVDKFLRMALLHIIRKCESLIKEE